MPACDSAWDWVTWALLPTAGDDGADDAGEQHAHRDGHQPAEERGAGVETPEALLADLLGGGRVAAVGVPVVVGGGLGVLAVLG